MGTAWNGSRNGAVMGGAILVVEDEPAIQELIAVNLEHAGHQVLRAANVSEAEALVREVLPDLVLLDWMLPGPPGVNFARQLRADQRTKDIPIIMLTARAQEQDTIAGLESGADDYVTKPFSPRELLARIKAVMRRRAPQLTDDVVEIADLKLDPVAHRVTAARGNIDLGVYSRAQLLDEVWGDHVFVEERTVDVHIRRLRQALEPTEHDSLVETVRGTGYRFRRVLA